MKLPALLAALLALSLAANVWLLLRSGGAGDRGFFSGRQSGAGSTAATAHSGATGGAASGADAAHPAGPAAPGTIRWRGDHSAASLRQLLADLEAAGLPRYAANEAIEALVNRHTRVSSAFAKMPFWYQAYGGSRFKAEADKMNAARRDLLKEVFGPEENHPDDFDPISRNVHWGDLPSDKVAALLKLENDYGEIYREQFRGTDGARSVETAEGRLRLRLIEEERMRDVAATLTPEEFKTWEMRSSRAARNVIQGAKNIDLSETEYTALLDLQRAYEAKIPTTAGAEETAAYLRGWAAPLEQIRTVLTDDRLYAYLEGTDPLYGTAAKFATAQSLPRAQTNALYELQLEAVQAVARAAGSAKPADFVNTPAGRDLLAPFGARLDTLLGPERAAAYRRDVGNRIFTGPR